MFKTPRNYVDWREKMQRNVLIEGRKGVENTQKVMCLN